MFNHIVLKRSVGFDWLILCFHVCAVITCQDPDGCGGKNRTALIAGMLTIEWLYIGAFTIDLVACSFIFLYLFLFLANELRFSGSSWRFQYNFGILE